jgi:hypothetical protein
VKKSLIAVSVGLALSSGAPSYASASSRSADSLPVPVKSANAPRVARVASGESKLGGAAISPAVIIAISAAVGLVVAVSTGGGRSPG